MQPWRKVLAPLAMFMQLSGVQRDIRSYFALPYLKPIPCPNQFLAPTNVLRRFLQTNSKKYQIIYADPPWSYRVWNNKENTNNAIAHYPTMSIEDICSLPIQDIAAENTVLFIWVTFPLLYESFRVIHTWGFSYKTVAFCWVKRNKKSSSWFFGLGHWTRANAEICLLCTKGKPKRVSAKVHQIIDSPIREHSQKPDEVRSKIVELIGDVPRIELFARQQEPGWDVWGNEVESSISLPFPNSSDS